MAKSAKPANPYDAQHLKNLKKYEGKLNYLFAVASGEAAKAGMDLDKSVGDAAFVDILNMLPNSVGKSLNSILDSLYSGVHKTIVSGIKEEWKLANSKNDALVEQVFGKDIRKDLSKQMRERYFGANQDVQNAFVERKEKGMELSDQVWNLTKKFKEEMEMGIAVGLKEGRTAQELSRDLRSYLNNPDALFRRVRREPGGPLVLSKHAREYHPGRGVYRSAYKNALRLAGTEINIAYRTADHERWQKMDFVVGIHIGLSNNHTLNGKPLTDICDTLAGNYPKDFKFTGWHPHCRCIATTILKSDKEIEKDSEAIENGEEPTAPEESKNFVGETPAGFNDWVAENEKRIKAAGENGTLPYFITDNQDRVNGILGIAPADESDTPKTLQEIDDAIKNFQYSDPKLVARREEIEAKLKELFDGNDFGMEIDANLLGSVYERGFLNTFEVGDSNGFNGSDKVSGAIEDYNARLIAAHRMFMPSNPVEFSDWFSSAHYYGPQLDRSEYEKYGLLVDSDKTRSWLNQRAGYGGKSRSVVRFKKDSVNCTWTPFDSMGAGAAQNGPYFQPSLTSAPKVESFDGRMSTFLRNKYKDLDGLLNSDDWERLTDLEKNMGTTYFELQYHGRLTIDDVESITLKDSPEKVLGKDLVGKLMDKGIELWYWNGSEVVQYTGKPTALEIAAQRHAARTEEETKAKWDAFYARREKYAKIVDEVNAAIAEAKEYKDLDPAELQRMVDKFDLYKAQDITKEVEQSIADMKEAENKLSDLIPDVHKWHGQFTIDQLNAVHDAVEKKMAWFNKHFSLTELPKKLKFEADYMTNSAIQQKYETWEVSQAAYLLQLQDVEYKLAVQNLQSDLAEAMQWSADHLKYKSLKGYVLDFKTAVMNGVDIATLESLSHLIKGEYAVDLAKENAKEAAKAAAEAKAKAEKAKADYDAAVQLLKADLHEVDLWIVDHWNQRKLRGYFQDFEDAVAAGADLATLMEKARLVVAEYEVKSGIKISLSDSSDTSDPSDPFSKARKTAAVWDKKGGKEADAVLFDIASKLWQKTDAGTRESMWGYTASFCHINEPLEGRSFYNDQERTLFERQVKNMTDYINKSELPCDMWFQRGESDLTAIIGRLNFMGNSMPKNLQDLVGMEMQEGGFLSTGSAKGKGFNKSVIVNIYAPKGTKAAYCEPFSQYGYGAQYGIKNTGRHWDGKVHLDKFEYEDETLFQRGTVLRITKVEDNRPNGKIYIDCEIIRQDPKDLKYVKDEWIGANYKRKKK
ncbi:MAG: ADP-ribosyltransferase [Bacteroidales bacterium]|nr:ADP-ribosyltransferase [Bacteroidales bacterium]